jgi:hypothetical protein
VSPGAAPGREGKTARPDTAGCPYRPAPGQLTGLPGRRQPRPGAAPVTRQPAVPPAAARRPPKPLSRRDQLFSDITIALGPGLVASTLAGQLEQARLVRRPVDLYIIFGWLIVPAAVMVRHRARKPPPPRPATPARRALTRAATAVTRFIAVPGTIAVWALVCRHDLAPWSLLVPGIYGVVPVQAAYSARHSNRAVLRPASAPPARCAGEGTPRFITCVQAAGLADKSPAPSPAIPSAAGKSWTSRPAGSSGGKAAGRRADRYRTGNQLGHALRARRPPGADRRAYEEARRDGRRDPRWPALPLTSAVPPLPEPCRLTSARCPCSRDPAPPAACAGPVT